VERKRAGVGVPRAAEPETAGGATPPLAAPAEGAARGRTATMPLADAPLAELVGWRLARASVPVRQVFLTHVGGPLELRPVEFSLLMLLLANGRASPGQLAQALAVTPPKVTALLDRLAARALVKRQRNAADGRATDVLLTPAGRALAQRAHGAAVAIEAQWSAQALSAAERAMLLELLAKLAAAQASSGSPT
jgi:DNA-binding MarR family transcriptional regulator